MNTTIKSKEITEADINWEKESHWSTKSWFTSIFSCKKYKATKESSVHRDSNGFATDHTRQSFFIEGDRKEYKTIAELLTALNKK